MANPEDVAWKELRTVIASAKRVHELRGGVREQAAKWTGPAAIPATLAARFFDQHDAGALSSALRADLYEALSRIRSEAPTRSDVADAERLLSILDTPI
jgi:hypothetical protein